MNLVAWIDTDIGGRKAAVYDNGEKRLYVAERFGAVEAWVGHDKIGNFESVARAKIAAARHAGVIVRAAIADTPIAPVAQKPAVQLSEKPAEQPEENPIDDVAPDPVDQSPAPSAPAPPAVSPPLVIALYGRCDCGAAFGRSGRCPALCQPVAEAVPYTGPVTVGVTHTARLLSAPARRRANW